MSRLLVGSRQVIHSAKATVITEAASHATHDSGGTRIAPFVELPLAGAVLGEPGALLVLDPVVGPDTVEGAENVKGSELGITEPEVLLAPEAVEGADPDAEFGGGLVSEPEADDEFAVLCRR